METPASPPQVLFTWPIRIYWEDTDAGGVVYHASYLKFLERARTEWLRSLGMNQSEVKNGTGLVFLVREMRLDFLKAALLDDELQVTVAVKERRSASILFTQSIFRADGTELLRAEVRIACVDTRRMRPAQIPDGLIPGF